MVATLLLHPLPVSDPKSSTKFVWTDYVKLSNPPAATLPPSSHDVPTVLTSKLWPLTSQLLETGGTAVRSQGMPQDPVAGLGPLIFSFWEHGLLTLHAGL